MALQSTTLPQANTLADDISQYPRADLIQEDFEKLISTYGRRVLYEMAIMCPCKSAATNQLSDCKNCGGTGYAFLNPVETRMVLQGFDVVTKNEGWSEVLQGMMRVSCNASLELTHMDKITALDGDDWYNQSVPMKSYGTTLYTYTTYPIKKIKYIALFKGSNQPYQRLLPSDYTVSGTAITFLNLYGLDPYDLQVTIRYKYAPIFYVKELKRSTMENFRLVDGTGEKLQHLPLSAYAQRAHYVLNDVTNLAGDKLIDNSYQEDTCSIGGCNQ